MIRAYFIRKDTTPCRYHRIHLGSGRKPRSHILLLESYYDLNFTTGAWLTIWLIVCEFNKEHLGCFPSVFSSANSSSILSFCPQALAHLSLHLWERLGIERVCVVWKLYRKQKDLHIFTIRDDFFENTFNSNISLFSSLFSASNPSHVMSVPLPSNWFLIKYFLLPQGNHSVPLHLLISHILRYQKCYLLWKR